MMHIIQIVSRFLHIKSLHRVNVVVTCGMRGFVIAFCPLSRMVMVNADSGVRLSLFHRLQGDVTITKYEIEEGRHDLDDDKMNYIICQISFYLHLYIFTKLLNFPEHCDLIIHFRITSNIVVVVVNMKAVFSNDQYCSKHSDYY